MSPDRMKSRDRLQRPFWQLFIQRYALIQSQIAPVQRALLAGWLLTMIAIPIVRRLVGDAALHWMVNLSVCILVMAVLAILYQDWGMRRLLAVVIPVLLLAWSLEWIGHTTGYPFGSYKYTATLQPQIGGVPVLIPLAWLMMLPSSWAVGSRISGNDRGWAFVLISAAAFTAWDFFLDPQMVNWGYWQWAASNDNWGSTYFGIPWINFGGWFLGSALITILVRPPAPPIYPLLAIYGLTWILQSIGQAVFWAMPGPAFVGFLAMGFFVVYTIALQPLTTYPIR